MARFARCAQVLMIVDAALIGLFMWGPGLAVPPATSVSPPSVCIAQALVYQGIGMLQAHIVSPLVCSLLLCALASVEVAVSGDETITGMHPLARRFLRGCMVLAVLLSGVSVGLGLRTYAYVLEAKVTVLSCLPVGVRFSFFASYAVAAVVSTYVFGRFLWVVVFYE